VWRSGVGEVPIVGWVGRWAGPGRAGRVLHGGCAVRCAAGSGEAGTREAESAMRARHAIACVRGPAGRLPRVT
jgi:hypothetical protein